jgi:FAD:protein FMN transferase
MTTVTAPYVGRFQAMASPCEVLIDTDDLALGAALAAVAEAEARRIEAKFSRYVPGNIVDHINTRQGRPVDLDEETAHLIGFADTCYRLSGGLFDITTGALRRAWRFDAQGIFPSEDLVRRTQTWVGWNKVRWKNPSLILPRGMEIDLGGIAKEYAVDRALGLILQKAPIAALVNFGGDIAARGPRRNGEPWAVGIESVHQDGAAARLIHMNQGGLTTSGDSRRFLLHQGRRYSHILNPLTGFPVEDAPRSVTVAADTCTQAGFLSTLGILKGKDAEHFLQEAGVRSWCYRDPSAVST